MKRLIEFKPDETKGKLVILGFEFASMIVAWILILIILLIIIFWIKNSLLG